MIDCSVISASASPNTENRESNDDYLFSGDHLFSVSDSIAGKTILHNPSTADCEISMSTSSSSDKRAKSGSKAVWIEALVGSGRVMNTGESASSGVDMQRVASRVDIVTRIIADQTQGAAKRRTVCGQLRREMAWKLRKHSGFSNQYSLSAKPCKRQSI